MLPDGRYISIQSQPAHLSPCAGHSMDRTNGLVEGAERRPERRRTMAAEINRSIGLLNLREFR